MVLNKFKFDIIVCTFNGSSFISTQLESILSQSILPQKIIVSDDGSCDETLSIVIAAFENANFMNYEIIQGPKKGVIANFLFALKHCEADFIFLADQDDIWHKDKVSEFAKIANNTVQPSLIFSDAKLIDEHGKEIASSFFQYQGLTTNCMEDDSILYKNCVQGAACAINRPLKELVLKSLDYINIDKLYMHDWWLALLAHYYGSYQFINKPLIEYRQHSKNQVGVSNNRFRFILYFSRFSQYWNNFKKAISQKEELEKFAMNSSVLRSKSDRQYQFVPQVKRILIKLLQL